MENMAGFSIDSLLQSIEGIFVDDEEKILSFEGRQMKLNSAEDAQIVVDEIEANYPFSTLVFKGNTINMAASEKISGALEKCQKLTRALWSDMFTGRSKLESPPALKLMCNALITAQVSLTELDLSDNAFGPAGAEAIKTFLASSCCYTLQTLKLNNDGLGIGGGKIIAESLISCWKSSKNEGKLLTLKCFVAGRNRLENDGAKALSEAFKVIGTLEEITLPQNGIYHDGISALADAFAKNRNLKRINLEDNIFTAIGASHIASVLSNLKELEILNLNDCLLKARGAVKLARALKNSCSKLKELLISGNEINSKAAMEIGEALFGKRDFEKVDMGGNAIGEQGIQDLRALFKGHNALDKLEFSGDDEGTASEAEEDVVSEEERDNSISYVEEYNEEDENVNPNVENFLITFDAETLCDIGDEAPFSISKNIMPYLVNPYYAVHVLLKISSLITPDCHVQIRELAYSTCREILGFCEFRVFIDILAQKVGVIKGENQMFRRPKNLYGILYVLKKESTEPYFGPVRDVLKFLAEKQLPKILDARDKELWTDFCNSV